MGSNALSDTFSVSTLGKAPGSTPWRSGLADFNFLDHSCTEGLGSVWDEGEKSRIDSD